ncbi:uncharacterized protein [Nicotiana tomentosiformis]|uniref:uncharacterized protein n=1 Tax=Nicotiana tomentosiformis TaxID=4098 RepID=UPI00388C52FE
MERSMRKSQEEMWDKLEVTYNGTSKVKETHINMLVHDYELFQMKEGESIEEMFARFSKIISDLKAFGSGVIAPAAGLSRYDCHRGDKGDAEARPENDIDDDPQGLEEEIAMVSRNMDGLMRRKYMHVQAECPELKRKASRGFNKNKSFRSLSDEDSSEHEEIANLCFMTILENDMKKYSGYWTDEDTSDDESKENTENCFMARGETSKVRSYNCDRCNELQDILDLTLKESQKMLNELRRLNREKKDWELKLEVCEIKRDVLLDEVQELQMQLNGMRKSTSHSSVKSNQETYKSTGKGSARTESTNFVSLMFQDGFGNPKTNLIPEHHRKSHKGKWYLDSVCSSHMTCDKNLFKEVTKINRGSVKLGDDSRGKIVGTGTVPFNNKCDITEVYLLDGLNYNLLNSHICLASISDDPWLWHKKLGHASMHLIEKLSKHDLVIGLSKLNFSRNHVCDACQIESVHVIFNENNTTTEKGIIVGDEDINQETSQTSKSQKSTGNIDTVTESTNEPVNNQPESQKESTTHTIATRLNEWRSEPKYPQHFIIGDPSEGIKTRGSL